MWRNDILQKGAHTMSVARVTRGNVIVVKNCDGDLVVTAPNAVAAVWAQADTATLAAAIASGAMIVEYDGPPKRKIQYHSLQQMRSLLAEVRRKVAGAPTHRRARHRRGFR